MFIVGTIAFGLILMGLTVAFTGRPRRMTKYDIEAERRLKDRLDEIDREDAPSTAPRMSLKRPDFRRPNRDSFHRNCRWKASTR